MPELYVEESATIDPPYILQPIRKSDLVYLKRNSPSKEMFILSIIENNNYNSLIDFVYKNQTVEAHHSVSDIKDAYLRYISYLWDITR